MTQRKEYELQVLVQTVLAYPPGATCNRADAQRLAFAVLMLLDERDELRDELDETADYLSRSI